MEIGNLLPDALRLAQKLMTRALEIEPLEPGDDGGYRANPSYLPTVRLGREVMRDILVTASRVDETALRKRDIDRIPQILADLRRQEKVVEHL